MSNKRIERWASWNNFNMASGRDWARMNISYFYRYRHWPAPSFKRGVYLSICNYRSFLRRIKVSIARLMTPYETITQFLSNPLPLKNEYTIFTRDFDEQLFLSGKTIDFMTRTTNIIYSYFLRRYFKLQNQNFCIVLHQH